MSLDNLANILSEASDRQGALAPAKEAVEIYRRLARDNPQAFEPNLAHDPGEFDNRPERPRGPDSRIKRHQGGYLHNPTLRPKKSLRPSVRLYEEMVNHEKAIDLGVSHGRSPKDNPTGASQWLTNLPWPEKP